ncbi:MAG: hypothetical protein NDI94_02800 [Candidatus Woesearchaeota archaeon]|nr:hypothetical protein [Candidatus Woesearchaeota archaeon]
MDIDYSALYGIFREYAPFKLDGGYSLKRWQGLHAGCKLHPLEDALFGEYGSLDRNLILFSVNGHREPVFSTADFVRLREDEYGNPIHIEKSNFAGIIAERVAWVTTHSWLTTYLPGTLTGEDYEEGHVYASCDDIVLKVSFSPRLVLLKQVPDRIGSYDVLTDIDGLFAYNYGGKDYLIVQEAKTDGLSLGLDDKMEMLFDPLRNLFPSHTLIYLIYSDMDSIYKGGNDEDLRRRVSNQLKQEPIRVFKYLAENDIGTLFFGYRGFNRSLAAMVQHLEVQQKLMNHEKVIVPAVIENGTITLMGGDSPFAILRQTRPNIWNSSPPANKKKSRK